MEIYPANVCAALIVLLYQKYCVLCIRFQFNLDVYVFFFGNVFLLVESLILQSL